MENRESEERGRAIVQTLAAVIESMVQPSTSVPLAYYGKTKFEAFRAPGISIRDYLMRIHKYASCSPECFVLALVYIDRLHQLQGILLTELNVHRIVITSLVLAAKFFDDHYFNNAYYAKVGGVPCSEMNELEVEYLLSINFSLHVCSETYARYYNGLAAHYIFASVRNASIPGSKYRQLRHYVTPDPEQEGQLVYVTDVVREEPPRRRYPYQPRACKPHPARTYQDDHERERSSTGKGKRTPSPTATEDVAFVDAPPRSGQKRRQSVALGVNA